jgi:hypothetical protein
MADETPTTQMVSGLWDQMKDKAAGLGGLIGAGYGATALSQDDEDMLWDQRFLTIEQEHDLWRARKQVPVMGPDGRPVAGPDGSPLMQDTAEPRYTPEEIGKLVFQNREALAKRGGNLEPKDQYRKFATLAQRAERRRLAVEQEQQQPDVMPPAEGMV